MISRWGCIYLALFLLALSVVNEKTRDVFIRDIIAQTERRLKNDKTK